MDQQKELIDSFSTTTWLVGRFGEGITHDDSIATPPFRANSFNWVLGHILVSRDRALTLLKKEPVLTDEETTLYDKGSDQLNPAGAILLSRLLEGVEESQKRLAEGLSSASDDDLKILVDEERKQTVGDKLKGLHWHETYHVGQLEILRQVNGERDVFP